MRDPDGTTDVSFAGNTHPVPLASERFPVAFGEMDAHSVIQDEASGASPGSSAQSNAERPRGSSRGSPASEAPKSRNSESRRLRAGSPGDGAEGAAAAAKQISETCVPHDVPTEVKDAAVAAKTKREGDEAFIKGDNVNAIDKYTQSLDADGTNEKVWANRAAAKLKLKDFHGALRDARTAKVIDCDYVKAWFREGSALTELGDYENAALTFFEGMQVEGQSENPDLKRGFDEAIRRGRQASQASGAKP